MAKIKETLKAVAPPVILSAVRAVKASPKTDPLFAGSYSTWEEAKMHSTGYQAELILQKCRQALLKVKNGGAAYERDSVLFDEVQYSWPLLASLENIALCNQGKLTVLDFGGSLGSSYFQNKQFLSGLQRLQWCIVEQPHFVKAGKKDFEDRELKFYYSIEDCLAANQPDVLLLSSVLQYLPDPYTSIQKLIELNIPYILVDRTAFIEGKTGVLTIQNVPASIYKASYPAWFFNEQTFITAFSANYRLIADFEDSFAHAAVLNKAKIYWKGFFLKQRNAV